MNSVRRVVIASECVQPDIPHDEMQRQLAARYGVGIIDVYLFRTLGGNKLDEDIEPLLKELHARGVVVAAIVLGQHPAHECLAHKMELRVPQENVLAMLMHVLDETGVPVGEIVTCEFDHNAESGPTFTTWDVHPYHPGLSSLEAHPTPSPAFADIHLVPRSPQWKQILFPIACLIGLLAAWSKYKQVASATS